MSLVFGSLAIFKYSSMSLKIFDSLLEKSLRFKKLATETSSQSGDIQAALEKAGLWGGSPFDLNGPVANTIFDIFEKINFQGRVNAQLSVGPDFSVILQIDGKGNKLPEVKQLMQNAFAKRMSEALKQSKIAPPAEVLLISWLEGVGNV